MGKTHNPWHLAPGLNHVGAYQVSGEPFVTGTLRSQFTPEAKGLRIVFPKVTKWVRIINYDATASCTIGFSSLGIGGTPYSNSAGALPQPQNVGYGYNRFVIPSSSLPPGPGQAGDSGVMEWKLGEIWLTGSGDVTVLAGLTNIPNVRCSSSLGPSYSGSSGVG